MEAYIIEILEREQQPREPRVPACLPAPEYLDQQDDGREHDRDRSEVPIVIDMR